MWDSYRSGSANDSTNGSASRTTSSEKPRARPKSTPAHKLTFSYAPSTAQRPKTAQFKTIVCERLNNVEHESFRQQRFISHLPVKQEKAAQKAASSEIIPVHTAPGYILTRSKNKLHMVLRDELFDQVTSRKVPKLQDTDPEIQLLVTTLKQQVADLNIYLEEERWLHKETKRKAADFLEDKVEEMRRDQKDSLKRLENEHQELLAALNSNHSKELDILRSHNSSTVARLKNEMEFVQAAFDTFQSSVSSEHQKVWKEKESELTTQHLAEVRDRLAEQKSLLQSEFVAEQKGLDREHNKALAVMKKEWKKEIDAMHRRYANHTEDLRILKRTQEELEDTRQQLADMTNSKGACEKELVYVKAEFRDTKLTLELLQADFQRKVNEVDSQYQEKLNQLMEQNAELRKLYIKKCTECIELQSKEEDINRSKVESAKQTMKRLIEIKHRANVSMASGDVRLENHKTVQKDRPQSAPTTAKEEEMAILSAGQTAEFLASKVPSFARPQSVIEMTNVFNLSMLKDALDE